LTIRILYLIIVTKVTMVKMVTKDPTVITEVHLTSLGRNRDRWCIILPKEAIQYLGKRTRYEIQLRPLGSVSPVKVIREVIG